MPLRSVRHISSCRYRSTTLHHILGPVPSPTASARVHCCCCSRSHSTFLRLWVAAAARVSHPARPVPVGPGQPPEPGTGLSSARYPSSHFVVVSIKVVTSERHYFASFRFFASRYMVRSDSAICILANMSRNGEWENDDDRCVTAGNEMDGM